MLMKLAILDVFGVVFALRLGSQAQLWADGGQIGAWGTLDIHQESWSLSWCIQASDKRQSSALYNEWMNECRPSKTRRDILSSQFAIHSHGLDGSKQLL